MSLSIKFFDDRRDVIIPGDEEATIKYCVSRFINLAKKSIDQKNCFTVALSGGNTPKAIYKALSTMPTEIDWSKVLLFFSDERSVSAQDSENNYHMAMEAGLKKLPILEEHIFRMEAEENIEENALKYEETIENLVQQFDLVMLGMGEDGHTASLFPETHGLKVRDRLVIANYVQQKKTWRMSLTYDCINSANNIDIYVIGKSKAPIVVNVLEGSFLPDTYPIQQVGTAEHKALWVLDEEAASFLTQLL